MVRREYLLAAVVTLVSLSVCSGLAVNSCEASGWNVAGGGSWAVPGNWTGGIPNGVDAVANFAQDTPDADPDFDITSVGGTIGSMLLQDTVGTANYGWDLTSGSLSMDVTSGSALIHFHESLHEIYVPITLHDDLDVIYTQTSYDRRANLNRTISSATGMTTNVHINRYKPTGFDTANYGRVVFYGDNTFNGDLTVHAGSLQIANWSSTPNGAVPNDSDIDVKSGATLRVLKSETFDALNGAGLVTGLGGFPNVTITIGNDNGSGSFSGVIQDGGSTIHLTKTGTGTQTLTGANSFTGDLTVSGGTLNLNATGVANYINTLRISNGATVVANAHHVFPVPNGKPVVIDDGTFTVNRHTYVGALTLTGATVNGDATNGQLRLQNDVTTLASATTSTISTVPAILYNNVTFDVADGAATTDLSIGSTISGNYTITKAGTGTFTLSGANTHTGGTTVSAGTIYLDNNAALGANSASVVLGDANTGANDVALLINSTVNRTIYQDITVSSQGTGTVTVGSNSSNHLVHVFAGDFVLGRTLTLQGTITDRTTFTGDFSGTGDLIVAGPNRLTFDDDGTYTGDTYITAGMMQVQNGRVLPDTADVHVSSGATLRIWGNNITETMDGLYGAGTVQGGGGAMALQVGTSDGDGSFSGVIKDESSSYTLSLVKAGTGTQILSGANTYSGTTTIEDGTLALGVGGSIDASPLIDVQAGATFDVTAVGGFQLASGHTLMGSGTVEGDLTLLDGSIHAPGASPGIQTVVGDYELQFDATLEIELDGTVAGVGYDQVNVDGGLVTLDGTLDLMLGFAPDVGSTFTIIDNDGLDGVVGNFTGLSEGATLSESFGGTAYQWTITYAGGDGNDVVLSNVPEPATLCLAFLAGLCLLGYRRRRT